MSVFELPTTIIFGFTTINLITEFMKLRDHNFKYFDTGIGSVLPVEKNFPCVTL